jgi:hypothetical protein
MTPLAVGPALPIAGISRPLQRFLRAWRVRLDSWRTSFEVWRRFLMPDESFGRHAGFLRRLRDLFDACWTNVAV